MLLDCLDKHMKRYAKMSIHMDPMTKSRTDSLYWSHTIFFLCAHERNMYVVHKNLPVHSKPTYDSPSRTMMHDLENFSFSEEKKVSKSQMCTGLIVFSIVILIIVLMTRMCKKKYSPSMYVTGRKSHMQEIDCHAKTDFADSSVHNLTHCSENDKSCSNIKNVLEEHAIKNGDKFVEFDKEHSVVLYMIYAPWCPHCHKALPNFMEASKKSDVPFALINAELMPHTLIQGEDAIVDVKHFPFFCFKNGETKDVFKNAPTTEKLLEFVSKKSNDLDLMFA